MSSHGSETVAEVRGKLQGFLAKPGVDSTHGMQGNVCKKVLEETEGSRGDANFKQTLTRDKEGEKLYKEYESAPEQTNGFSMMASDKIRRRRRGSGDTKSAMSSEQPSTANS